MLYDVNKHQRSEDNLHQQPTYIQKLSTIIATVLKYVNYRCLRFVIGGLD